MGKHQNSWSWRTGLTYYEYNQDLSLKYELLAQYYFKAGVIDQLLQLSNWELYSDFAYLAERYSLSFGVEVYELHIEREIDEQVYVNFELPLSDEFGIGTMFSYSIDATSLYSEFFLSVHW